MLLLLLVWSLLIDSDILIDVTLALFSSLRYFIYLKTIFFKYLVLFVLVGEFSSAEQGGGREIPQATLEKVSVLASDIRSYNDDEGLHEIVQTLLARLSLWPTEKHVPCKYIIFQQECISWFSAFLAIVNDLIWTM